MGGFGSGRTGGDGRERVEACRSIDVNQLHETGCLRAGWAGSWQWTSDGEKLGWINLRAEDDQLHLSYRVRIAGGEWEDVAETVRVVRVPCRFGGDRPYFICPGEVKGVACSRRVSKLYGSGRYFLCRHCLFPLSALLSPRSCVPERGHLGPHAAARQQDPAAPRRRSRYGRAFPAEAERHVATHLSPAAQASLRG